MTVRSEFRQVSLPGKDKLLLEGEGFVLRPIQFGDANEKYLAWLNDDEVTKGLETISKPYTMEMLQSYVSQVIEDKFGYMFMIEVNEGNHSIGTGRVHTINLKYATCNLGMMIGDKNYWGKGYGKKVYRLLIRFAFQDLNIRRIWEAAHADNVASLAMCEGLGFRREGILREHVLTDRGPMDKVMLGLLKKEWNP
jgi:[ribosomal protein S5]-alanine N-acetyltransferase